MKSTKYETDVKIWLDFAAYDLKTAKWNYEGKIYTSACYASQQTAEKAIKALLLAKGKKVPKIHNLDRLLTELTRIGIDTSEIKESAIKLNTYYIFTRYPGQYGGPEGLYDKNDALTAIQDAEFILEYVLKLAT